MQRVELVLGIAIAAIWVYSIVTCVLTPEAEVRGIPKALWLVVIVLLPLLGSVLWLGVGRVRPARAPRSAGPRRPDALGGPAGAAARGYIGMTADERIRRMEEDLARLDQESFREPWDGTDPDDPTSSPGPRGPIPPRG